jgi:hypothetical protein
MLAGRRSLLPLRSHDGETPQDVIFVMVPDIPSVADHENPHLMCRLLNVVRNTNVRGLELVDSIEWRAQPTSVLVRVYRQLLLDCPLRGFVRSVPKRVEVFSENTG